MSEKNIYYYRVPNDCPESFYKLETRWDIATECRYVFEDAAKNFFDEHGGWEDSWPIEFTLHETENGPELAHGEVELFSEPTFRATEYSANFKRRHA